MGRVCPVVCYEDVGFTYVPGDPPALRQVNFAIQRGQTVALVGRSGSGKTTAMHLLLRFWDPERGRILLGGHDVRQYTLDTLRQQMALVSQDTYLFNASVRENLRLGRPDATDAALEQAAREAPCTRVYHGAFQTTTTPASGSVACSFRRSTPTPRHCAGHPQRRPRSAPR